MGSAGAAVASAAGPVVGGLIGNLASKGQREGADQLFADAYSELHGLGYGPDLSKEIIYKQLSQAGMMTPELEKQLDLGISQVEQIKEAPELRNAQMDALRTLQQRGKVGLSPEDRAALNQVRSEVQRDAEAKRQQILQQMQARGQGGSGAELIAQLQAAQGGANQASQQGDELAANASRNALQAMAQSATLGGQIRGQDFDVNQAKAAAADLRSRFNVEQQLAQQQRNVGALNQAQAANLAEKQRIQDANTAAQNQELYRRKALAPQQMYQNEMNARQARAGASMQRGQEFSNEADKTAAMWAQIGSAAGQGASAYKQQKNFDRMNPQSSGPDAAGGTTSYSQDYLKS